jgi:type IV secretion system protein VirB1
MQVNSANLTKYNTTVKEMLDPCKNIYVASSIYYDFYKNTPKNDTQLLRTQKALSAYNTGSYTKGFKNGYVGKYFSGAPHSTPKHVKKYAKYLLSIKFPSRLTATLK